MKLADFEALTFDCYGTLIDWDSGICHALAPLLARAGIDLSGTGGKLSPAGMGLSRADVELTRDGMLEAFARLESRQQEKAPSMAYPAVLAEVHAQLAVEWDVARHPDEDAAFGQSVAEWPAFPDTVEALRYLKRHYRLVILSNVDRSSFQATNQRLGVEFDAIYTAEDIGSYKPDPSNFRYMLDRLREQGVAKEKTLHVAQSLFHDHVPARAVGLASAWIDRRHDADGSGATASVTPDALYDFYFTSLGALVEAHRDSKK